jgi:membrane protease YdiL (CAAX protease family)
MSPNKTISRSTLLNITIVLYGLLLLIGTAWSHWLGLRLLPALHFNYRFLFIGIVAGSIMALSAYGFYMLARKLPFLAQLKQTVEEVLVPLVAELKPIDLVFIAAISGFCEEIFFRGIAQQQFGLPLTSVAFGLFHDPTLRNVGYSMLAAFYGLILGLLYIKTGNLWVPIIAHATHNLISFILLRYYLKPPASSVEQR